MTRETKMPELIRAAIDRENARKEFNRARSEYSRAKKVHLAAIWAVLDQSIVSIQHADNCVISAFTGRSK